MASPTGRVIEREWKKGRGYALRFTAYGKRRYVTLGFEADGWNRGLAEEELANVLADVRRGIWVAPRKETPRHKNQTRSEMPIFGSFARGMIESRRGEVADSTTQGYEWRLRHLLEYFADWPLNEIDIESVDAYRNHKVKQAETRRRAIERGRPVLNQAGHPLQPMSADSINKTIDMLRWVLSIAIEYGHIETNPAIGRRRRLKVKRPPPVHLDTPGQIQAIIDAGAELDHEIRRRCVDRQPIVATLVLAGPRAHELCHLLWRDIDLANGRIMIGRSKTQAGLREIKMLPLLRDILASHKAKTPRTDPDDLVFPTESGRMRDKNNLLSRVLRPTFERADELLLARGQVPLPNGLTTHKLRHTFASILVAIGEDPLQVMSQLGHVDPGFTLRVYSHLMSRDTDARAKLKALVNGERVVATKPESDALSVLTSSDYERPILKALAERGGRASRQQVLTSIRKDLGPSFSKIDLERLPSGILRWEALVGKARDRLTRAGFLRSSTQRGLWELTGALPSLRNGSPVRPPRNKSSFNI